MPNYITNSQAIKPSVSFLNLKRDEQVFNHYVDLASSPSTLQKRPSVPTSHERSGAPSYYENERTVHLDQMKDNLGQLGKLRSTLYEAEKKPLRSPLEKRNEVK